MRLLTTEELNKRLKSGPLAIFDVRGDVDYDQGHIPDAMSAPLGSLNFRVASVMNPDSEIVFYSNGPDCDLAAQAVERLENHKFTNVLCYQEGMDGWLEAGHSEIPSARTRDHTWGEVIECRPLVVDRKRAYGGAFDGKPTDTEGAGG